MATKKTDKNPAAKKAATKKAAARKTATAKAKAAPKARAEKPAGEPAPRHPRARVEKLHNGKAALAKALAASLARDDEDSDVIATRLATASNTQLLRLQKVVAAVKEKYGSREKLIEAIGDAAKKSKDKDYLAKLGSFSLPRLLDMARSSTRAA